MQARDLINFARPELSAEERARLAVAKRIRDKVGACKSRSASIDLLLGVSKPDAFVLATHLNEPAVSHQDGVVANRIDGVSVVVDGVSQRGQGRSTSHNHGHDEKEKGQAFRACQPRGCAAKKIGIAVRRHEKTPNGDIVDPHAEELRMCILVAMQHPGEVAHER